MQNYSDIDSSYLIAQFLALMAAAIVSLCFAVGGLYVIYFLVTLPMRRNERARLFLDLLELGLKEGRTPEAAIIDAGASRDVSLGARFHLLVADLEKGVRLGDALVRVPRLLPPPVIAMLRAGEKIGDYSRVLPACRRLIHDGVSQTRGAGNYLILLAFTVTPLSIIISIRFSLVVVPRFREVFAGTDTHLPAFSEFVLGDFHIFILLQLVLLGAIWSVALIYLGGPRLTAWAQKAFPGLPDRIQFLLPWRRKRMQRDFSAMLAALLDGGTPESEAVNIAADATANAVVQRRGRKMGALLAQGVALPEAIRAMDDTGQLQWRVANALRRGRGFLQALTGWHEALDAKAFQLEQTAAQLTTTFFVLLNGLIIGCIVGGIFLGLISIINGAPLW